MASAVEPSPDTQPGGFVESNDYASARPLMSKSEISALVPDRGKFTFPAPYNTEAIRLTNADDCGGTDCVNYIGYSYWRNINNHVGFDSMLIFVGLSRGQGGAGPTLLEYNKTTDEVSNLGPVFNSGDPHSNATAETWYFSASMPTALYLTSGSKILRYDVISKQYETVLDITSKMGANHSLWQTHTSNDDRVHSSTVKLNGQDLGCMAYIEDTDQYFFYAKTGYFDECQVDRSGRYLIIKEGSDGLHNRIVDLTTQQERILLDPDGAVGHSDVGYGYMIGADNWANKANTQKVWDLTDDTLTGTTAYSNNDWWAEAPAHLSHTNARPDIPMEDQYACGSSVNTTNSLHANEIICFRMDASGESLVVAPVMTSLSASGGGDPYSQAPKGNLDVTGKYFIWTSNMGGNRLDAFLVKIPGHLLTDNVESSPIVNTPLEYPDLEPTVTPDPEPTTDSNQEPQSEPDQGTDPDTNDSQSGSENIVWVEPANPEEYAVTWTDVVNVGGSGPLLIKTNGCQGCADAGAASQQQIDSENGFFEFTASEKNTELAAGLTNQHAGTTSSEIDFGFMLVNGVAEVRENGQYKSDTTFDVGDVLRVQVIDDQVSYLKNGDVFYVSNKAPVYPLRADTAFFATNASIANAVLFAGDTSVESSNPDTDGSSVTDPDTNAAGDSGNSNTLGSAVSVNWIAPANVTIDGTTLTKQWGCDGCADAGAASEQIIEAAHGYFEFTATSNKQLYAGLTSNHAGTSNRTIDYAISLGGNYAEVRENDVYKGEVSFTAGDVFRVQVAGGEVSYLKNGEVFYVSSKAATSALRADTAFLTKLSSIKDAVMVLGLQSSEPGTEPTDGGTEPEPVPQPEAVVQSVVWGDLHNATLEGDILKKAGGCNGCADSGAVSQQGIASGNGYLEFTISRTWPVTWIGLADNHATDSGSEIDYAFRLSKRNAEVRENGILKTTVEFRRGDILRIEVVDNEVSYMVNGEVVYTSTKLVTNALRADVTLVNRNSEVANAMIKGI